MRLVFKFCNLPSKDRRLLVEAALLAMATRIGLWTLPFRRLASLVQQVPGMKRRMGKPAPPAMRFQWAVQVASHFIPGSSCLSRALTLQGLLARYGRAADLRIGVSKPRASSIEAHAWIEMGGQVLLEGSETDRYTPLLGGDISETAGLGGRAGGGDESSS